jgi:hypothetical protein
MTIAINLAEKLDQFSDYWSPRTVAQLNQYDIMVVKAHGEFVWHQHDDTARLPWEQASCVLCRGALNTSHSPKRRSISC